ncbi:DUF456 domain-containing protein [Tahibacter amnicola]|uniref:DUF456 domain-containing protein n=1 Tax=Tahibacter amnicola TaxID=2976241 RepID=A0ABY6BGC5_9GAMM|nr:DUF456 domain-containing protein [Tahibacter amnicola]UXI69081.1 DUF456 domain-containing protein [Tahibacter amnicola]
MTTALYVLSALLILAGLAGTILPALPGVPLMYAGMFLVAWVGGFQEITWVTLVILGVLCVIALGVDLVASLLGAKRVGASRWALVGAAVGTVVGIFFALPGLILGPFVGALAGELLAGSDWTRATNVGVGTWLGFLFGTLSKIALAFTMLGVFLFALWLR